MLKVSTIWTGTYKLRFISVFLDDTTNKSSCKPNGIGRLRTEIRIKLFGSSSFSLIKANTDSFKGKDNNLTEAEFYPFFFWYSRLQFRHFICKGAAISPNPCSSHNPITPSKKLLLNALQLNNFFSCKFPNAQNAHFESCPSPGHTGENNRLISSPKHHAWMSWVVSVCNFIKILYI